MNSWNEEDENNDFSFVDLEQILLGRKQNGIFYFRGSIVIFNGYIFSFNGVLKIQDCLVFMVNSVVSRFFLVFFQEEDKVEKSSIDFRDCILLQLQ